MIENKISQWLREYAEQNNIQTLVVGVSGGIDSAVTSTLCAMTGIPTIAVNLPLHSKQANTDLSNKHLKWLSDLHPNVKTDVVCMDTIYDAFEVSLEKYENDLGYANSKSRIRMVALYQIAAHTRGMVVGTGNKVEDFGVGFFTKYGDGGVDISPIADLTKTQVRELAANLGIAEEIIEAPPTDGLWEDSRSDEQQIGASYKELEWVMEHLSRAHEMELTRRQKDVINIYNKFHTKNGHKMRAIPVFKLPEAQGDK